MALGAAAVVAIAVVLILPGAALAVAPTVVTSQAFSTAATTAEVDGTVNPAGQSTTYQVQYDVASSGWCQTQTGSPANTTGSTSLGSSDNSFHGVTVSLPGLTAGTAYCAQVIATNGDGQSVGGQATWTQGIPVSDTFDAFSTGATTATVEGDVDPSGQSTTYKVEYDAASSLWCTSGGASGSPTGSTTPQPLASSDSSFHGVSVDLTGLTGGTPYCAEIVASNGSGTSQSIQTQWTQGIPSADTFTATSTGATTATVEGDADPVGQATTYAAQYDVGSSTWCTTFGASGSPANTTTAQPLGFTDLNFHNVSVDLNGLTTGTAYCAQVVATNGSGQGVGGFITWTEGTPLADTFSVASTGATTATLAGDVNPAGQTTNYAVAYDLAGSDWCTSGGTTGSPSTTAPKALGFTDSSFHDVSVDLTGLSAGSQYCAEVTATNASGEGDGFQLQWTQGLPSAFTSEGVSTGATTATVSGSVNPTGQSTMYAVQYDVAGSAWCMSSGFSGSPAHATAPQSLGSTDNTSHEVSVGLTGLSAGSQYCAQVIATNGSGQGNGGVVTWNEGLPGASTTDAFSTTSANATVDGAVNPAAQSTDYKILYDVASSDWCSSSGASGSPAFATTPQTLGFTDNGTHSVSVNLTGLTGGTSYCAELSATNGGGTTHGFQVQWTQGAPTVDTIGGEPMGATTATVSGDVNPAGDPTTTYEVEYGDAGSEWCTSGGFFGAPTGTTTAVMLPFGDGTSHSVAVGLTGLTPDASYCGEVLATNADGTGRGSQAFWSQPSATLTVHKAGSGSGGVTSSPAGVNCGATCSAQFDHGTQITLTATPASGSTFAGWTGGGCSGTGTCKVTLNADTTVTATFSAIPPPHTLTVSKAGSGSGSVTSSPPGIDCGATCAHAFTAGTQVTLTAAATIGSTFAGWAGGGCSGTGTCKVTLNSDTTVTATFNPATAVTHTLTVSPGGDGTGSVTSNPAGIDCGSTCSHVFVAGNQITLTAAADSGSTFTGWSGGGCSGTGDCVVTLSSDTTVTATFAANPPPPPPTMCIVPKLKGKTVAAAKRAIKKAHCSVGKITKVTSSPKNRGRVVSQSPKPGKHLKKGSKVALKIGK